jgi:hypothetical protein
LLGTSRPAIGFLGDGSAPTDVAPTEDYGTIFTRHYLRAQKTQLPANTPRIEP